MYEPSAPPLVPSSPAQQQQQQQQPASSPSPQPPQQDCHNCAVLQLRIQELQSTNAPTSRREQDLQKIEELQMEIARLSSLLTEERQWNLALKASIDGQKAQIHDLSNRLPQFEQLLAAKLEEQRRKFVEEKERLQRELECKVCLDQRVEMLILPCGHVCLCSACARTLFASGSTSTCPVCRRPCQSVRNAYL
eukprot:TRINITY_DN16347_c0_g1::TRINITY_DN16347_c0_g1_i1::g.29458::m.29458 TRINITY_DN16347_c0_g1::TRINITY_DN16347_c0_g1_i1::g.29458  ORF type:complete len:193 (-),score=4.21,sp/A9ULZ2/BIR7B_XENLA/39.06/5e-08,zf-C3HC4_3/PF13920.1/2.5e+03,zf-C3HC4_3/PF13920.1/2.3e-13,zf-C3HC4_2/PF13923.1/6.4e+03,zf-C3HC4_2/PF13923.1/1.2e-07,zf-C3HC4/PF00097.20/3.8e+03,zf-C3HC4/PF00097.20/7.3e-06,zf-RING_2/PF13639.1/1.5e-05,zf-RING_5/PF14634.1/2.7e+03,zf-RING_5/PF14634.1/9.1e-06,Lzipper-MIP1/PF14389.1/2.3e+02,Lzipper-MIP1/P